MFKSVPPPNLSRLSFFWSSLSFFRPPLANQSQMTYHSSKTCHIQEQYNHHAVPNKHNKVHALVVAAGKGARFGSAIPKQYTPIDLGEGLPKWCILEHSLTALAASAAIDDYTLVVAADDEWVDRLDLPVAVTQVLGGSERWQSVACGVAHIASYADDDDLVLIHDAARPCLGVDELERVIDCAYQEPNGAILGVKVADTLKSVKDNYITGTTDRSQLWCAQTPQVFRLSQLLQALDFVCHHDANSITDEAMAFEALGLPIKMVAGKTSNIKLTTPDDLLLIAALLKQKYSTSN